jgi:uncharacterized cupredoxin-like copper-binding protein
MTKTVVLILTMLLPATAWTASPWTAAQVVTVVMVDDRFQPNHVTFQAGQAYRLRLLNRGKELHEFTAPDFFKNATLRDKRQLSNSGIEVVVQPGGSVTVFLIPRVRGDYSLTCADHDWNGMTGGISVQ